MNYISSGLTTLQQQPLTDERFHLVIRIRNSSYIVGLQ